jgi:hypothetical protein
MKREASTLTLVMALLFSSAVGALSVNLVKANPAPLFSFPTESITTPPTIVVTSPVQNQTYNTTVGLSLTIIKPETWFAIDVGHHSDGSPINQTFVNITSVYYVIDGGQRQNITVHDVTSLWDTTPTLTLNLSTALPMAVGTHNLEVGLEADSYYVVRYTYNFSDALSSVKLHAEAAPINFRVATDLGIQLESFPITPIAASVATVAIVSLGSLVYFKKRKR